MWLIDSVIDWHSILFGKEHWSFLPQLIIKTVFMFFVIIISLRLIGRRGIMKGVFQVITIIMLGSSAGDPMLYSEVGVLPATLVFIMTILLYRLADFIVAKYSKVESYVEGRAIRIINEGRFEIKKFPKTELSKDEIFADLRKEGVSHLGQVLTAYMEAGGEVSVFYCRDEEVRYGLPILPELIKQKKKEIQEPGHYSCVYCAYTDLLHDTVRHICPICGKDKWVHSINNPRIR
ncbi:MAG TPA: YetF domain-containing protein [Flavisolibacter sp.]|nr:YetF domain-containing protein [Flavisolibacter sp.]